MLISDPSRHFRKKFSFLFVERLPRTTPTVNIESYLDNHLWIETLTLCVRYVWMSRSYPTYRCLQVLLLQAALDNRPALNVTK